jgi:uncharacterized RDD family membrane protein YckC
MAELEKSPAGSVSERPIVPPEPSRPSTVIEIFDRRGEGAVMRWGSVWLDSIIIDVVFGLIAVPVAVILGLLKVDSETIEFLVLLLCIVCIPVLWFLYFTILEGTYGTTVGKFVGSYPLRLRVIQLNGGRISYGQAALRALIGIFETNIIGAIAIEASPMHQRLGDLAAGTLVIDQTKIRRVEFLPDGVRFEFIDGRAEELVRMTRGVVTKWLNVPQSMTIEGVNRKGEPVTLRAVIVRGLTVFSNELKMDQLRARLEETFQIRFTETLQWYRLILILAVVPIVFCGVFGVLLITLMSLPGSR